MKSRSRELQSSKPNPTSEFVNPISVQHKSYYDTNRCYSYSDLGPYGDPLSPHYSTCLDYGDESFCFSDNYWNENEQNDQLYDKYESYFGYDNLQPPYDGGNWVGEYETYFGGGRGEDLYSGGYGTLDEERGPYSDAKVEGDLCWGDSYYGYDGGMEKEYFSYEDSFSWFGFWGDEGFNELKENDDSLYDGLRGLDEMRLCDTVFGHW